MISKQREADVLRLFHAERWTVGTIARQLGLHHSTVRRVLSQSGTPEGLKMARQSIVDDYIPLIVETLEKYPTLTSQRLFEMARARGFTGSPNYFRAIVSRYRPRPKAEAYQRLRTPIGEQAQVDWAHFDVVEIGQAKRKLMAFVMVLSWSRQLFVRFYLNAKMSSFLRGHVAAFEAFGGIPRCLLYDNLKSAVLERQGDAIRFHPTLLELAAHYRFEPRPVAVARGNEKGRVERAIRYIRSSFFAARKWSTIADLNQLAQAWSDGIAAERACPEDLSMTVGQAFELEKPKLLGLPEDAFPTLEQLDVKVSKTPYVRFDLNDYSIPHEHVRKTLTVLADLKAVRIVEGDKVLAQHERCWGRREVIEDQAHLKVLQEAKRQGREHRGLHRLHHAVPSSRRLIEEFAKRGSNLGGVTLSLLKTLDLVGATELEAAIAEVLRHDTAHLSAIQNVLEKRRYHRGRPPPVGRHLPQDPKVHAVITHHNLGDYDQLTEDSDENT